VRRTTGLALGLLAVFVLVLGFVPPNRASRERIALLTLVVYGCVLVRVRFGMPQRPEPEPATGGRRDSGVADEQDVRLARLDTALRRAVEEPDQYARVTRPMLRSLAAERLRNASGVDPDTDPQTARRLLGEELWQIFATAQDDHAPPPGRQQLAALVAGIERL
jgi:hypothetical protein